MSAPASAPVANCHRRYAAISANQKDTNSTPRVIAIAPRHPTTGTDVRCTPTIEQAFGACQSPRMSTCEAGHTPATGVPVAVSRMLAAGQAPSGTHRRAPACWRQHVGPARAAARRLTMLHLLSERLYKRAMADRLGERV